MENKKYKKVKYTVELALSKSPQEVFHALLYDAGRWLPEDMEGQSSELNDEFVFRTGDSHYSKNRVVELVPDQKLAWLTLESMRKSDGFDWSGTKYIFELTPKGDHTELRFTYDGVAPEDESERLVRVCDMCIKEMFYNFVINGKAM